MKCKACHKDTRWEPYMPIWYFHLDNTYQGTFHPDCYIESLLEEQDITLKQAEAMYQKMGFSKEGMS